MELQVFYFDKMLSHFQIRGVFLQKTVSKFFPFAGQGASVFLVSETESLLWEATCTRSSIWLSCQCKNAVAGSACLQQKELRERDTKDCEILRKISVKLCFSEQEGMCWSGVVRSSMSGKEVVHFIKKFLPGCDLFSRLLVRDGSIAAGESVVLELHKATVYFHHVFRY